MFLKTISQIIVIILLFSFVFPESSDFLNKLAAEGIFKITFTSSLSPGANQQKNSSLLKKLSDLVFGEKSLRIIKPVNLLVKDKIIYILDQKQKVLFEYDIANNNLQLISGSDYQFPCLAGICEYVDNQILFTDSALGKIFCLNRENKKITPFSPELKLIKPTGIIFIKEKEEIWICETGNHIISVLDKNGNLKNQIGSRGNKPGQFNFPTFMAMDNNGIIFIVDSMNFRVQRFDQNGNFLSMFGEQGDATGFLAAPKGIAIDSYNHVYLVDALYHSVQVFDDSGQFLSYFGQQGNQDGDFFLPMGIDISSDNLIFVCDCYNSRIQVFQLISGD